MQKIKNQKGFTPLIILGAMAFLIIGAGVGYVVSQKIKKQAQQENKVVKEEKKEEKKEQKDEKKNITIGDVEMPLPAGWSFVGLNDNKYEFETKNYTPKGTHIFLEVRQYGKITEQQENLKFDVMRSDKNIEIFGIGFGGALFGEAMVVNGDYYEFYWDIDDKVYVDDGLPEPPAYVDKLRQDILKIYSSIKALDQTADWQTYKNEKYGFEMKVPKEFEEKKAGLVSFESERGWINVNVWSKMFNPENIYGTYGKVEKPTLIKIGNKDGYGYAEGDAGCGAQIIETALTEKLTLSISFSSCEDQVKSGLIPVGEDRKLIDQVLSSFKFDESKEKITFNLKTEVAKCKKENDLDVLRNGAVIDTLKGLDCGVVGGQVVAQNEQYAYFSTVSEGIGGFIMFPVYFNLYQVDLKDNKVTKIFDKFSDHEFSSDLKKVIYHDYLSSQFSLFDIENKTAKKYKTPEGYGQFGDFRFSPDENKVAFIAFSQPDENGYAKNSFYILTLADGRLEKVVERAEREFLEMGGWDEKGVIYKSYSF